MTQASPPRTLRRELRIADAAAFSIGLIGPVGAMAVNGVGAAGILGTGATWAFIFALAGVVLVAYGFIKLSQHISNSGSVFGLVGVTLGPRAGFIAGWALAGAYLTIGAGSTIAIGLFVTPILKALNIASSPDWLVIAVIGVVVVGGLSLTRIRIVAKILLVVEFIGIALVVTLGVVVLVRLIAGHAPAHQALTWRFLSLPHGTGITSVGSAAVFGFLAFAGFEGAASLGEETIHPKRDVPRAIFISIIVVSLFYLFAIITQSLGFGVSAQGVKAFQQTTSTYGDLGNIYVGKVFGILLNTAAALSSLAISLGTMNASARIMFSVGRATGDTKVTTKLSKRAEPTTALFITLAVALLIFIGQRLAGTPILPAVLYWLTLGTLSLLVAYALATLGAIKYLFLDRVARAPKWQIVVPILALGFIGYVIYRNTVGVPAPYDRFPYYVLAWILLAALLAIAIPGLSQRVRSSLASTENATTQASPDDPRPHHANMDTSTAL